MPALSKEDRHESLGAQPKVNVHLRVPFKKSQQTSNQTSRLYNLNDDWLVTVTIAEFTFFDLSGSYPVLAY